MDFRVINFRDNSEIILPFFRKHPILGIKSRDFQDWCKIIDIIREKAHTTSAGFEKILKIKANMNRHRSDYE